VALRLSLSFDPPNFFKRIGFSPLQRMEGVQFRTAITGNGLTLAATKAAASEATEAATAAPPPRSGHLGALPPTALHVLRLPALHMTMSQAGPTRSMTPWRKS
jgi:hypothetical protein